jgi:hypothetical protein
MPSSSRRNFLAGSALAAVAAGSPTASAAPAQTRTLGRTGLKLNPIGFGCMVTSDGAVITHALDLGINYFDTARVYSSGNNERMVGAALKGKRDGIILSSKSKSRTKAGMLADLDTSLKELGTDHLDIWYLHDARTPDDIKPELIEAQQEAKKAGKVRFPALSLHANHAEVVDAGLKTNAFDVILITYNFAQGPFIEPVIEKIHKAKVGVVAMKVMAGAINMDPSVDYKAARAKLEKPGAALAALKWVLKNPNVDAAIPSMRDFDQLDENLRALKEPFGAADTKLLAAAWDRNRSLYCRMCGTCSGKCPKDVPVQDVLRVLNYADGYGEFAMAREEWLKMSVTSSGCADCTRCAVRCANGLDIQARAGRAFELFG